MKRSQAWSDTVCLLSGASPARSTRPGEAFTVDEEEGNTRQVQPSVVLRLYRQVSSFLNRLHIKQPVPLAPFTDQPEYRYRKG